MKKLQKIEQDINISEKLEEDSSLLRIEQHEKKYSRRQFLKKSIYSAPTLIVLGQLAKPKDVQALDSVPSPPPVW